MAITTVHHRVRKLNVPAAVLGGLAATLVGVATAAVVVDRDDAATPVEQVARPPLSGLGFIFSDAFPSDVVAPPPLSGLGFVFSDAFPSEVVARPPLSGLGFVFSDAFPSEQVMAD